MTPLHWLLIEQEAIEHAIKRAYFRQDVAELKEKLAAVNKEIKRLQRQ
jgi:uncharacterized small protein (DUF1192 family)